MTQRIIEENFLKVGASRYQSQEFNREFPEFSSISRFGIGILSAFMIADEVEVIACHPDEQDVRKLTLRSVHGKYLIQLLDKESDPLATELSPHGTLIRINVRPSTPPSDVLGQARKWIVVPGCNVTVQIDDGETIKVGYDSPRNALVDVLRDFEVLVDDTSDGTPARRSVHVIEKTIKDVTIAFAVEWSEFFQDWSFLTADSLEWRRARRDERIEPLIGTCVEGIRVDFSSPGYREGGILSIANATGKDAPKTNVARSGLENTPERDRLLEAVYSMYCEHVKEELTKLTKERSFSLTWAVREARILLARLVGYRRRRAVEEEILLSSAKELPVFIVERDRKRAAISAAELSQYDRFWTVDGAFFESAEELIREVESEASLSGVIEALRVKSLELPTDLVLCTVARENSLDNHALLDWEVDTIKVDRKHRRVDLGWSKKQKGVSRWHFLIHEDIRDALSDYMIRGPEEEGLFRSVATKNTALALRSGIVIASDDVAVEGASDEAAVEIGGLFYLLPQSTLGQYLRKWLAQLVESRNRNVVLLNLVLFDLANNAIGSRVGGRYGFHYGQQLRRGDPFISRRREEGLTGEEVLRHCEARGLATLPSDFDAAEFGAMLNRKSTRVFSPSAWRRSEGD
jgi:hypothetical protein